MGVGIAGGVEHQPIRGRRIGEGGKMGAQNFGEIIPDQPFVRGAIKQLAGLRRGIDQPAIGHEHFDPVAA